MIFSDISRAIRETISATQLRISGHRLRRRSISQRQSQCGAVPGRHPEASCANSVFDLDLSSRANPGGTLGVGVFTESNLAATEKKARAYYESISRGGMMPDCVMRTDLTDQAYLASVGCLDLLAEIRRLQSIVAASESPGDP